MSSPGTNSGKGSWILGTKPVLCAFTGDTRIPPGSLIGSRSPSTGEESQGHTVISKVTPSPPSPSLGESGHRNPWAPSCIFC